MSDDLLIRKLKRLRWPFLRPRVETMARWRDLRRPAQPVQVAHAEQEIGFTFPALLTRLYTEVGNGGFGPGYGFLGVQGGKTDGAGCDIVRATRRFRASATRGRQWNWPNGVVPLIEWGNAVYTCLDLRGPEQALYELRPDLWDDDASLTTAMFAYTVDLGSLLASWLHGIKVQELVDFDRCVPPGPNP